MKQEEDEIKFEKLINNSSWRQASSPGGLKSPHQYLILHKTIEQEDLDFIQYMVDSYGVYKNYFKKRYKYFDYKEYSYFVMGHAVNRGLIELQKNYNGGIDQTKQEPYGGKKMNNLAEYFKKLKEKNDKN